MQFKCLLCTCLDGVIFDHGTRFFEEMLKLVPCLQSRRFCLRFIQNIKYFLKNRLFHAMVARNREGWKIEQGFLKRSCFYKHMWSQINTYVSYAADCLGLFAWSVVSWQFLSVYLGWNLKKWTNAWLVSWGVAVGLDSRGSSPLFHNDIRVTIPSLQSSSGQ